MKINNWDQRASLNIIQTIRLIFGIILIISLLTGCADARNKDKLHYDEDTEDRFKLWRYDSIGCLSHRYRMITNNEIAFDSLIGLNIKDLKKYMGNPNRVEQYSNKQTVFYYYVSCKYKPVVKNIDGTSYTQKDSLMPIPDITKVEFRIGAGAVRNYIIITP